MTSPKRVSDGTRARSRSRSRVTSTPRGKSSTRKSSSSRPRSSSRVVAKATPSSKSDVDKESPKKDDKKSLKKKDAKADYDDGTNWVEGGVDGNPFFLLLVVTAPLVAQLVTYVTVKEKSQYDPTDFIGLINGCGSDPIQCGRDIFDTATAIRPTLSAACFLLAFNGVALVLEVCLPGKIETGPETHTGHIPQYKDNGFLHCIFFSVLFLGFSNLGFGNLYDFGIIFDEFGPSITILNIFGILFAFFLYFKGLHFPSTKDCGSSGSFVVDYLWGTELYPRIMGVDIKRFINCRFSMTFWQLAGLSFAYRSYTLHGALDYGLLLTAISQYLYLVKFFWWEMGYMRSIDIIVDRAGFEIQWGCLVYVPSVYTFHSRFLVLHPSGLSPIVAGVIFAIGLSGVVLNYIADEERMRFRETNGAIKIWGKDPVYVKAEYSIIDQKSGKKVTRTSLLLASGFWGVARHFHYVFELTAAWSWCLLANPLTNGPLVLIYCVFLTCLLLHRAKRDEIKCSKKYGKDYEKYSKLVPYLVIPGVY